MLKHLARDVQAQVGGVDYAAHEVEALRQHVGAVLHNHDAAGVQLQTRLVGAGHVVEQLPAGYEQQRLVAHLAFGVYADYTGGVGGVVPVLLVEVHAVLVADLALGALPDGYLGVDGLALDRGDGLVLGRAVVVFLARLLHLGALHVHLDGPADVVGVLLDQAHYLPGLEVVAVALVVVVGLYVHDDVGADAVLLALRDGVAVGALALPLVGGVGAEGLGDDGDLVGDHECAVEADAELAYDVRIRGGILLACVLGLEGHGAALGDDAEVLLQLVTGHAYAVVADGQSPGLVVGGDEYAEVLTVHADRVVGQRAVAQLVYRVGRVGYYLTQEYLLVRVDGVDHQVEQPLALGLELFFHIYASNVMIYVIKNTPSRAAAAAAELGVNEAGQSRRGASARSVSVISYYSTLRQ